MAGAWPSPKLHRSRNAPASRAGCRPVRVALHASMRRSVIRRGSSLLEVIVALVLVVAIGALVLPAFGPRLELARFDHAVDGVTSVVMLARARAQETGRPQAVVWRPGDRVLAVEAADATGSASEFAGGGGAASSRGPNATPMGELADAQGVSSPASRWSVALDEGLELAAVADDTGSDVGAKGSNRNSRFDDPASLGPVRLALTFADGTVASEPFVLTARNGRRATFRINPWTGQATVDVDVASSDEEATAAPDDAEARSEFVPSAPPVEGSKPADQDRGGP